MGIWREEALVGCTVQRICLSAPTYEEGLSSVQKIKPFDRNNALGGKRQTKVSNFQSAKTESWSDRRLSWNMIVRPCDTQF